MHFPFWIGSQGANSCIPKVLKYVQRSHLGYWIKEINNGYSGSIRKDLAQACRSGWLPQIRAGSLQKGYPLHQSYKKIKKRFAKTVSSFQILVYPENLTVHAFWVPQKNNKCPKKPFTGKVMNGCSDSIGTGSALVYRMSTVGPKSVYRACQWHAPTKRSKRPANSNSIG